MVKQMPTTLQRLRLDNNFGESKTEAKLLGETLATLATKNVQLRSLSLQGQSGMRLGKYLLPFLGAFFMVLVGAGLVSDSCWISFRGAQEQCEPRGA